MLAELRDGGDALTRKVVDSYLKAHKVLSVMSDRADRAFLDARRLPVKYG